MEEQEREKTKVAQILAMSGGHGVHRSKRAALEHQLRGMPHDLHRPHGPGESQGLEPGTLTTSSHHLIPPNPAIRSSFFCAAHGEICRPGSQCRPVRSHSICGLFSFDWQVMCVAFSPDGQLLATASTDKTAKLWLCSNGQCAATCAPASGSQQFRQMKTGGESQVRDLIQGWADGFYRLGARWAIQAQSTPRSSHQMASS